MNAKTVAKTGTTKTGVKKVTTSKAASSAKTAAKPAAPAKTVAKAAASSEVHAGMTEAELTKMPAKEYMNDAQLAYFKSLLGSMRDDILRKVDETVEHMREQDNVADPADRATVEEEHALELRTRDRERKLLKKIEQAIHRIDQGEYGFCEETGEPIGIPRLLARPTATLSIEAQERRERMQKMYGD